MAGGGNLYVVLWDVRLPGGVPLRLPGIVRANPDANIVRRYI
jgi:hypothetical protein